jgi:PKD repeat protein
MKRRKKQSQRKVGLEVLEDRRLLSAVTLANGVLTLTGSSNQDNTFYVRQVSGHRIEGIAGNVGRVYSDSSVKKIVVQLGNKTDTVNVGTAVPLSTQVDEANGQTAMLAAGDPETFTGSATTGNNSGGSTPPSTGTTPPTTGTTPPTSTQTTTPTPPPTGGSTTPTTGSSSSGASSNASAPTAVLTITDGATIYPYESVHVQAVNSNWGSGDATSSNIQWNFGDPGSQYNALVGFNAAHVYTAPGVYTVTLTVTNSAGLSSTTTSQVTVTQDNRTTVYVSPNGNDANDGLSANDPIQSEARLQQLLASNMRVLFQSGGTYTLNNTLSLGNLHDVYLGSYGTGAQPILYSTNGTQNYVMIGWNNAEGIAINGLTFDSATTTGNLPTALRFGGSNVTILNNTFLHLTDDMNLDSEPNNVLIQGNSSPDLQGLRSYFLWAQGNDFAVIGNSVVNSMRESVIRVGGVNDILFADNNLANVSGASWGDTQDGVKAAIAIQKGTYAYVVDNTIPSGNIGVGPLSNTLPGSLAEPDSEFQYAVLEGNLFTDTNTLGAAGSIAVTPGAHDVVARNNVLYENQNSGFVIDGQESVFGRQSTNIKILNNTVIDSSKYGGFLTINQGAPSGVVMDNNLFIAPNIQVGNGTAMVSVDTNDLSCFTQIQNNVWAIPYVFGWARGGYFYMNSQSGVQAGYLTPAEWTATGVPTGDVYENVTLPAGSYSVVAGDFTAGATLTS